MDIKNTFEKYGIISKLLHWAIALLVFIQFYLVLWTEYVLPEKSPIASFYISGLHKPIGVLILLLVFLTLIWKAFNVRPVYPLLMPQWEKISARLTHALLYILLILMACSGFIMSAAAGKPPNFFGLYQFPMLIAENKMVSNVFFEIHSITAYCLVFLITIHILAALKHHFIDKDNILKRMT